MRSRRTAQDQVAEVARRRLELLSAELAAIRPDPVHPPSHPGGGGSGEPQHPKVPAPTAAASERGRPPGRHALRPVGRGRTVGGWVEDRLPASMQGRVRIGHGHLSVVAVVVAVAMALLAWVSVRSADPGDLVPARATSARTAAVAPLVTPVGVGAAASTPATPTGEVVVDVAGKVRRPGIVRLPVGSRVVDALEAAGGPRRGADVTGLNLARVLVDGEQVVVGVPAPPGVAPAIAAPPSSGGLPGTSPLVNLNTATQVELETLPGVGPVTASAILQWRTDNGAFTAVDELMEVSGIGEATLAELAPFVTI
jgi:competence protein ComEA